MIQLCRNIYLYRELLISLSQSYIKARYKQTLLGIGWAFVPPLLLLFTVVFVFPSFSDVATSLVPYPLFVFIGLWIWTLFSNSLSFAIPNLVQNTAILRKIYFPREILVIAAMVPILLDFVLTTLVLCGMLVYYHIHLNAMFFYLPFLVLIVICFTLGLAFIGAILNVAFRDIAKALPIILQVLFFMNPIIYSSKYTQEHLYALYAMNPIAVIIETFRSVIMGGIIDAKSLYICTLVSILVCFIGYTIFKKGEQLIVDII